MSNIYIKFNDVPPYMGYVYRDYDALSTDPDTVDLIGLSCVIKYDGKEFIDHAAKVLNWAGNGKTSFYSDNTGIIELSVETLCEFGLIRDAEVKQAN